eukprot:10578223-Alexandrium_andersonii.AAC.1
MLAKPSLLDAFAQGPPRPWSAQRGSACAASAWRTIRAGDIARASSPIARTCVRNLERRGRQQQHWPQQAAAATAAATAAAAAAA